MSSAVTEIEQPIKRINDAKSGEPFIWENWSRVIFPGFYDTWIGDEEWLSYVIEDGQQYSQDLAAAGEEIPDTVLTSWDDVYEHIYQQGPPNFYYAYRMLASEEYTRLLWQGLQEHRLDNIITSMKFDHLWSPKEYNWYTDCLNLILTCDFEALESWIQDNLQDFDKYLHDHWTSRDGFCSHVPNSYEGLKDHKKYREICIEYFLWRFMINDSASHDDAFFDSVYYRMQEWMLELSVEEVMDAARKDE